jgi:hypothetical protein
MRKEGNLPTTNGGEEIRRRRGRVSHKGTEGTKEGGREYENHEWARMFKKEKRVCFLTSRILCVL